MGAIVGCKIKASIGYDIKTVIPIADNRIDFSSEGFSEVELELMSILKIHVTHGSQNICIGIY